MAAQVLFVFQYRLVTLPQSRDNGRPLLQCDSRSIAISMAHEDLASASCLIFTPHDTTDRSVTSVIEATRSGMQTD
jgi:hypothetical protein